MNKKMRSIFGFLLLFSVFFLTACSGDEKTAPANSDDVKTAGADIKDATELTFWTFAGTHATFYANAADRWNEANPDKAIKLTVENYPFDQMHNNLLMALQSGFRQRYPACKAHIR